MIHINVDQAHCQRYGQCVLEVPDLFEFNEEGELTYQATVDDNRLDDAQEAADVCPVQAIVIHAADPEQS